MARTVITSTLESNIVGVLKQDSVLLRKAMKEVVGGRIKWGKGRIRSHITAAGYGKQIANAVRGKTYDQPDGIEGVLFSKAKVRSAGGVFDLISLFQRDVTIRGNKRLVLAIPNPRIVGKTGHGRFLSPADFPAHFFLAKMHDVYSGRLVARDNPDGPTYFWLVKAAHKRGRLDLTGIRLALRRDLSTRITRNWRQRRVAVVLETLHAA